MVSPEPVPRSAYLSNAWKDGLFTNKVVFCTGGGGTICSAQVRALVHLGANACIIGRNDSKTTQMASSIATARPGSKVIGIGSVDVRSFESIKSAVDRCVKELGSIDFVIAGAAGNFLASIANLSPNAFKSVVDIDLLGSYNTAKATLPHLLESAKKHKTDGIHDPPAGTGGRIIFVSATLHYSGTPFQAPASAAKAGVDSLSTSMCLEFGPHGLTSNVIAPGPIAGTEGMDRLAPPEFKERSIKMVPNGRYGSVKEIADATVFLFGDTGNFVNGTTVVVDGGHWHVGSITGAMMYPESVLGDGLFEGVKGRKGEKGKAKL
jgi:2,4-dienoyl-CoA reductase [(3E)-enoyl-CoA-producing], peroxisomal